MGEKDNITNNIEETVADADKVLQEENAGKGSILPKIIVPLAIVCILGIFAGVVYYAKVIKPSQDVDKQAGYAIDEQITLGQYTGFNYEITQEMWDECVNEEIRSYVEVERAVKETDQVEFNYTGFVDGKKDENITQKDAELIVGDSTNEGVFKKFSDALVGLKTGETVDVEATASEINNIVEESGKYTNEKIKFTLKVVSVSDLDEEKITDKWVKNNYFEDYGLENKKDFYEWCKSYIIDDQVKPEVWQMAIDAATMKKYPDELYNDIVDEFQADAQYRAEEWGMKLKEYLYDFCQYTDETIEEEYMNGVKSELVMWAIVKKQGLKATEQDIEERYENTYEEVGCDSVEAMKELYSKDEIKKAVLLEKAQEYVYDNSNIKETYKIREQ